VEKRRKVMDDDRKHEIMTISSYEKFIAEYDKTWNEDKRAEAISKFPYTIVVESSYPVLDYAHRWCWQNFGPYECKECGEHCSEYPACPKVLAIQEYKIKKSYTKDGVVHEYDFHTRNPGKHGHEGIWTTVWLGKTGYDYGFSEYYFEKEEDRDKFKLAIPTFGLGENYD
jgi:hypothetical protein